MNEKSEAQIRNEEEVRRILEKRGYSSSDSKKQARKTFSEGFPFGTFIKAFLIISLLVGGWIFLQNSSFEKKQNASFNETTPTKNNEELIGF